LLNQFVNYNKTSYLTNSWDFKNFSVPLFVLICNTFPARKRQIVGLIYKPISGTTDLIGFRIEKDSKVKTIIYRNLFKISKAIT